MINTGRVVAIDRYLERQIYRHALLIRTAFGILAWILTTQGILSLMEDALFYEEMGYRTAQAWLEGRPSDWLQAAMSEGRQAWLMVASIGGFYCLLGGLRLIPLLIFVQSLVTAWIPVLTYRITRLLGADPVAARTAGRLVAFSPAFVIWSGALYKEGPVLLLISLAVYHTLRLQVGRVRSLGWVLGTVLALLGIRFYMAVMLVGVIAISLLWGRRRSPREPGVLVPVRQAFLWLLFIGLTGVLGFWEQAQKPFPEESTELWQQIQVSRRDLATSAYSGYLPDADVSTPEKALRFFPKGLLYFLTVPLPWHIGRIRQNLVIPETFFWILLYPLAWYGLRRVWRAHRPGALLLAATSAGICSIYALLSGNIGVAYRMRTQVWLLWAPLMAIGWHEWRRRKSLPGRSSVPGIRPSASGRVGYQVSGTRDLIPGT
jgi:hypothetical protein